MTGLSWSRESGSHKDLTNRQIEMDIYFGSEACGDGGVKVILPVYNLTEIFEEVRENYQAEEIRMLDYESELDIKVRPYDDFYSLNDALLELNSVYRNEKELIMAIVEVNSNEQLQHVIDIKDNFILMKHINTAEDMALDYLRNMDMELPDLVMANLDLRGLGQDLMDEGEQTFTSFGLLIGA